MDVNEFNKDEKPSDCIARLIKEQHADLTIAFDCAGRTVPFIVQGFFVFPDGSLGAVRFEAPA